MQYNLDYDINNANNDDDDDDNVDNCDNDDEVVIDDDDYNDKVDDYDVTNYIMPQNMSFILAQLLGFFLIYVISSQHEPLIVRLSGLHHLIMIFCLKLWRGYLDTSYCFNCIGIHVHIPIPTTL